MGEYCKGIKHAVTPAMRNALKNQLYDSTVDNVNDPSIFVTYHDAQAYPESARGVLASRRRRRASRRVERRSYRRGPWPWRRPPDAIAMIIAPAAQVHDKIHAEEIIRPQRAPSG